MRSLFIGEHPMGFYSRPACSCPTFQQHACPPSLLSVKCDVPALLSPTSLRYQTAALRDRVAWSASIRLVCLYKIQFPPLVLATLSDTHPSLASNESGPAGQVLQAHHSFQLGLQPSSLLSSVLYSLCSNGHAAGM